MFTPDFHDDGGHSFAAKVGKAAKLASKAELASHGEHTAVAAKTAQISAKIQAAKGVSAEVADKVARSIVK